MACGLKQAFKEDYLNCGLRVSSNTHSDYFFWDNIITFGLKRLPCLGYKSLQSLRQPTTCFLQPPGAHLSPSNQASVNTQRPFRWVCWLPFCSSVGWLISESVVQQRVLWALLQQMCVGALSTETPLTSRDSEKPYSQLPAPLCVSRQYTALSATFFCQNENMLWLDRETADSLKRTCIFSFSYTVSSVEALSTPS